MTDTTARKSNDPARVTIQDATWLIGGHTAGMGVGSDNVFHPVWVDNHTKIQQLYTAAVTVPGAAQRNGVADLAEFRDVSNIVRLSLSDVSFDPAASRLRANARLVNLSRDKRDTVRGPTKARVVTLTSQLGAVSVEDSDNGVTGPGAIWDFTTLLRGGMLAPGDSSNPKRVALQVRDRRSRSVSGEILWSMMLELEARILTGETKRAADR